MVPSKDHVDCLFKEEFLQCPTQLSRNLPTRAG